MNMNLLLFAALSAVVQTLPGSAANVHVRQLPNPGNMTASYGMGNSTLAYPTTGGTASNMRPTGFRPTGFGTGFANTTSSAPSHNTTSMPQTTNSSSIRTTSTQNSTVASTSSSTVSTSASSAAPSGGIPAINNLGLDAYPYNLNNYTCGTFSFQNASQQWAGVDGDEVVTSFNKLYTQNLLICSECYGMSKDQCTSKSANCTNGLRDLAAQNGPARWDTAVGRFSDAPGVDDLICSIQTGECSSAPECNACNNGVGSGSYAMLKSMETLSNSLNNIFRAIQDAGSNCQDQMQTFSDVFAPLPNTANTSLFLTILTSIVGGLVGCIPIIAGAARAGEQIVASAGRQALEGIAPATLTDLGAGIGMNMYYENQPGPADTGSVLGAIVNNTAQAYVDMSNQLFTTGSYQYRNSKNTKGANIAIGDLMKDGNLMLQSSNNNDLYTALLPTFQLILYQQLAAFTWANLEKDNKQHTPFIAYTEGPCNKVTSSTKGFARGNPLFGVDGFASTIDYKGSCYWLLDGVPQTRETFARYSMPYSVCEPTTLPGGTATDFAKNAGVLSGLSLSDFIVPSVEGWLQNKKNNNYAAASTNGQLYSSPQAPGAVNFPVCDYVNNPTNPGSRCPLLAEGVELQQQGCNLAK